MAKSQNKKAKYLYFLVLLLILLFISVLTFVVSNITKKQRVKRDIQTEASQSNNIFVYNVESTDTSFSGTAKEQGSDASAALKFRTIKSTDYGYDDERDKYKTTIVRMAIKTPVTISVNMPGNPTTAVVRSPTADIPSSISNGTLTFDIPASPGNYYVRTNFNDDNGYVPTLVFWIDDMNNINTSPPQGAITVNPGQPLQSVIDSAGSNSLIYLAEGVHALDTIRIENKDGITLLLHPNAVLNQTSEGENFLEIDKSSNINIKGPGEIRGASGNEKTVLFAHDSTNLVFENFFLYKIHHRDGWTLHIYRDDNVQVNAVRVISGNDGTDPDSSTNVTYNNFYVEAQDDAVAVKTRSGVADTITINNTFAKSAASALKIGEATIDSNTTNITFKNSTVFDSDRALVVMPRGDGRIGNVLYQNIRVLDVRKNKVGRSIRVLRSPTDTSSSMFENANVIFDNIYAEFTETAEIEEDVTIKHSTFVASQELNVFQDRCPTLINLTLKGGAMTTCEIVNEAAYTPTPVASTPTTPPANTPISTLSPTKADTPTPPNPASTSAPPTEAPTNTSFPTETPQPTQTYTPTPIPPTETPTYTPVPTNTPTPTQTPTPTATPLPTSTPTSTPTPTFTVTKVPPTPQPTQIQYLQVEDQAPGFNPIIILGLPTLIILAGLFL